ncbi:hypothetical protein ASPVEDRAFT_32221 [Aspergillus versicolor CBS 583.65]|uniref:Phytocyanin domain-containing protein n=1 Tax=Aspergillus versicolor CBS 583.65 TaxID=1036611 RepID=A0A1L9PWS7_ASPVE|nr:uncharacterized protein ASPVEDRAFT_32221 [Aspergillus versicolor CBS 583.65]OJJ05876.1 hypothetical protein ASPVEDRAFT_32221 [Aspergillus versicolor CBS 583.65]
MNLCLILVCLPLIHAQYGNGPSSSTETTMETSASPTPTSSSGAVHTVDVGEDGFTYDPDTVTAAAGDTVEFHFYPGDHSVVQATFSSPCKPLNDSSIYSGFLMGTADGNQDIFTVTINDTNPVWFYCAQIGHCQAGMVGVINPPSGGSDTLDAFKSAASTASAAPTPSAVNGGVFGKPSETTSSASSSSSTSTSEPTSEPAPMSEGSSLRVWRDLSVVLGLSVLVGICMM